MLADAANPFRDITMDSLQAHRQAEVAAREQAAAAAAPVAAPVNGAHVNGAPSTDGAQSFSSAWQGHSVDFRTSKHEKGDRPGRWDEGQAGIYGELVACDRDSPSWRQKL